MRYFFDLIDGDAVAHDPIGDEVENVDAARKMAAALVVEVAHGDIPDGGEYLFACRVRDESGHEIHRANLTFWTSRG